MCCSANKNGWTNTFALWFCVSQLKNNGWWERSCSRLTCDKRRAGSEIKKAQCGSLNQERWRSWVRSSKEELEIRGSGVWILVTNANPQPRLWRGRRGVGLLNGRVFFHPLPPPPSPPFVKIWQGKHWLRTWQVDVPFKLSEAIKYFMPFWLHFSMDRQHFHIRKKPEISLSECFTDNGLTKNQKKTRFGLLRKHLLSHWGSLGKKEPEWDKETKTKVSTTANQRKRKHPNEPIRGNENIPTSQSKETKIF